MYEKKSMANLGIIDLATQDVLQKGWSKTES